jgi:hypothetical protein
MAIFIAALGETVGVVGGISGAVVVGRGIWESVAHPDPSNFYEVRLGDKTFSVSEAELIIPINTPTGN